MKLNQLEIFIKIFELKSLTKAAEVLGISKGQVSQHLKALEESLGLTLVERSNKGIIIPDSSEVIYFKALEVLSSVDDIRQEALHLKNNPGGNLKIYSGYAYAKHLLLNRLEAFRDQYPNILFDLDFSETCPELQAGRPELIYGLNGHIKVNENWSSRKIESSRVMLCASMNYLQTKGFIQDPNELIKHDFIAHKVNLSAIGCVDLHFRDLQLPIKPKYIMNSFSATIDFALNDQGVIQVYERDVEEHLSALELVEILPNELSKCYNDIYLYYYPGVGRTHPNIRLFLDFLFN